MPSPHSISQPLLVIVMKRVPSFPAPWVTRSSLKPPAALSANATMAVGAVCHRSCWARCRSTRPASSPAFTPVTSNRSSACCVTQSGAIQQHQPGGLADGRFARTRRRHHRRLPVRQRLAGQPSDCRVDRTRHRCRHRLRYRGDEPGRAANAGPLADPRTSGGGYPTCRTSSRPPSDRRWRGASPARTRMSSGSSRARRARSGLGGGGPLTAISPIQAPVLDGYELSPIQRRLVFRDQACETTTAGLGELKPCSSRYPHSGGHVVADLDGAQPCWWDGRSRGTCARPDPRGPGIAAQHSSRRALTTTWTPGAVHREGAGEGRRRSATSTRRDQRGPRPWCRPGRGARARHGPVNVNGGRSRWGIRWAVLAAG